MYGTVHPKCNKLVFANNSSHYECLILCVCGRVRYVRMNVHVYAYYIYVYF